MGAYPRSRAVAEQGAATIESFCEGADDDQLTLAAAAGCLEALTQAMLAHPGSARVQASSLEALSAIIDNEAGAAWIRRTTVAATGLAAASALQTHAGDESVVAAAMGAFTAVTYRADTVDDAVKAGCVGLAIAAMQQHPQKASIQQCACFMLGNVLEHRAISSLVGVMTVAEATSGVALAAAALSAHSDRSHVVASACNALGNFVSCVSSSLMLGDHLLSIAPDVAARLVSALSTLRDGNDVASAVRVLAQLCACSGGKDKVAAAGAAAAAATAAAKHAEDAELQEAVASLHAALQAPPQP